MTKQQLDLLKLDIKLSYSNIKWILSSPHRLLMSIGIALLFFELVYWMFNLEPLKAILLSNKVPLVDKLQVLSSPFTSVGEASGTLVFVFMIILSLIQGISLVAFAYVMRNQPKIDAKLISGNTFVSFLAVVGLGCPACGTSLITPLIALFTSSSTVALSETITIIALPIALAIGIYGLYTLGHRVSVVRAYKELS